MVIAAKTRITRIGKMTASITAGEYEPDIETRIEKGFERGNMPVTYCLLEALIFFMES